MAARKWTEKENHDLLYYASKGKTADQIGELLDRSKDSVQKKAFYLKVELQSSASFSDMEGTDPVWGGSQNDLRYAIYSKAREGARAQINANSIGRDHGEI